METLGEITIHIQGKVGNEDISPENYDVFGLPQVIECIGGMLFPDGRNAAPIVTYEMAHGSVKHIFRTKRQIVVSFGAVLSMVSTTNSLDGLLLPTARAFESMQTISRKQGLSFGLYTSETPNVNVKITPETNYVQSEDMWADAEFYFYGKLTDAGGKQKANLHLDTKEYGLLKIAAEKDYLANIKGNPLYRSFAVRAIGKQNVFSGEIDTSSLRLIEITDYESKLDEIYLNTLIKKGSMNWQGVDVDDYIKNVRGEASYV